mmetsp:Transcript_31404/g.73626  ORF Transcript_31404/g.73626 Transcript_31404/m.73626 type:complete len:208 (+) Transcript_31404:648-1271(+)
MQSRQAGTAADALGVPAECTRAGLPPGASNSVAEAAVDGAGILRCREVAWLQEELAGPRANGSFDAGLTETFPEEGACDAAAHSLRSGTLDLNPGLLALSNNALCGGPLVHLCGVGSALVALRHARRVGILSEWAELAAARTRLGSDTTQIAVVAGVLTRKRLTGPQGARGTFASGAGDVGHFFGKITHRACCAANRCNFRIHEIAV